MSLGLSLNEVSELTLTQSEGLLAAFAKKQNRHLRNISIAVRSASADDKAYAKFIRQLE